MDIPDRAFQANKKRSTSDEVVPELVELEVAVPHLKPASR
jgi:hypothetical protein